MNPFRQLFRGIVYAAWIFNMVTVRLIVLGEVFIVLILLGDGLLPQTLGTTMGDHVVYQYYHRGIFLGALPVVGAIAGSIYGQLHRRTGEEAQLGQAGNFFLILAAINAGLLLGMAAAWPESCLANPIAAIIAAVVMSGASMVISQVLSLSPTEAPPFPKQ